MNVFDLWLSAPIDVRSWYGQAQETALGIVIRRDFAAHFALGRPLGWQARQHVVRHQDLQEQRARLGGWR